MLIDQFSPTTPIAVRCSFPDAGYRGSISAWREGYFALSPVTSHHGLIMSYRPQAFGAFPFTGGADLRPSFRSVPWFRYFSGKPGFDVPTRAAYSHSAAEGSRTRRPVLADSR